MLLEECTVRGELQLVPARHSGCTCDICCNCRLGVRCHLRGGRHPQHPPQHRHSQPAEPCAGARGLQLRQPPAPKQLLHLPSCDDVS
jgi:hypothetical protein